MIHLRDIDKLISILNDFEKDNIKFKLYGYIKNAEPSISVMTPIPEPKSSFYIRIIAMTSLGQICLSQKVLPEDVPTAMEKYNQLAVIESKVSFDLTSGIATLY